MYDAAGNPIATGDQTHKYDASGRKIESVETSEPEGDFRRTQLLIQQSYDGDGQTVKRREAETFQHIPPTEKITYTTFSNVTGEKSETVFAESGQSIDLGTAPGIINWKNEARVSGSSIESAFGATNVETTETELFGGVIPEAQPSQGSPDWIFMGNYGQSGNPFDISGGCLIDGFPEDCAWVAKLMRHNDPRSLKAKGPDPFEGAAEHKLDFYGTFGFNPYQSFTLPVFGGSRTIRFELEHFGGEYPLTVWHLRQMNASEDELNAALRALAGGPAGPDGVSWEELLSEAVDIILGNTCGLNPATGLPGIRDDKPGKSGFREGGLGNIRPGRGGAGGFLERSGGTRHFATDITSPVGTPTVANRGGTVIAMINGYLPANTAKKRKEQAAGLGNFVIIDHGNGVYTLYAHLTEVSVTIGALVLMGQQIGTSGRTGNANNPSQPSDDDHVHFGIFTGDVKKNGFPVLSSQYQDPVDYLNNPCP